MWRNTKKIRVIGAAIVFLLGVITPVIGINLKSNIINQKVNNQIFEVNQIDESTIEIMVNPPDLKFSSIHTKTRDYTTLELPNEGFTTNIGEAKLPTIVRTIEIPQGAQPQIKIKSTSWEHVSLEGLHLPKMVLPVQPSVPKIPNVNQEFVIDEEYYSTNAFLPNEIAKITQIGEIRSHRFAVVEISPVQYNPVSAELKLLTSCILQIDLPDSNMKQTLSTIERYATPSFEQLLQKTFVNYGYYENFADNPPKDQEGYLIIVYDDFYNNIQTFANWKTSKGFDVTVKKTSEIPGGPTKENIKAYIVDAYNNWPNPPSYVLLVGDSGQVPVWTGTATGTCTDLYYVTIDTGNYFPDII
ncbi:MAG: C25 family peptidase propeptide domain-containing protein, partial [Thermoplasmatota archaeon]